MNDSHDSPGKRPVVRPVRRIVTGTDAKGRSIFLSDGPAPNVTTLPNFPSVSHVLWGVEALPARLSPREEPAPAGRAFKAGPAKGGLILRVADFAPDSHYNAEQMQAFIREFDISPNPEGGKPRHFWFHRTTTLDFGLVLEGEIWALMDVGETLMRPGDIIVQRATNHSWANRSDKVCRMAFVLMDSVGDHLRDEG